VIEHLLLADWRLSRGSEANAGIAKTFANELVETAESATDDKQNVLGVDGRGLFLAAIGQVH